VTNTFFRMLAEEKESLCLKDRPQITNYFQEKRKAKRLKESGEENEKEQIPDDFFRRMEAYAKNHETLMEELRSRGFASNNSESLEEVKKTGEKPNLKGAPMDEQVKGAELFVTRQKKGREIRKVKEKEKQIKGQKAKKGSKKWNF
jgi:hypothetical protein